MPERKIHYVWEGANIAQEHAANMLLTIRHAPRDVAVTVWTSRAMSIMATLSAMANGEDGSPQVAIHRYLARRYADRLTIGDTRLLYARLEDDLPDIMARMPPELPGSWRPKDLPKFEPTSLRAAHVAAIHEREISGPYRNYGAASDWTRVIVLLLEGGTYLDVDVVTRDPRSLLLNPDSGDFLVWNLGQYTMNAALAARKGAVLSATLLCSMFEHMALADYLGMKAAHDPAPSWSSKRSNYIVHRADPTGRTAKMEKVDNAHWLGRLTLTINTSGPGAVEALRLKFRPRHHFPENAMVFHRLVTRVGDRRMGDEQSLRRENSDAPFPEDLQEGFDGYSGTWHATPRRRRASTPSLTPMPPRASRQP